MILKKPYAFLVKHFRMIHAALFTCALLIFLKIRDIIEFFNTYIDNSQRITSVDDISSKYIDWSITFLLVLVIIITGIIIGLMIYKKKPKIFYLYTGIMYLIFLILTFYLSGFLYDIQFVTPDLRFVKILRDIIFTLNLMSIPIIIMSFVRTIGFDVKKFDFKKDLMDLGIEEEDNEEYVLDLKIDSEDIKANIRKRFRYFVYFFKENTLLFMGIGVAVVLVILVFTIKVLSSMEKIYKEGEVFQTNALRIEVLDSYKTNTDAVGEALSSKNFYVILKLRYTNISNSSLNIYTDNALLSYDGLASLTPTMKLNKTLSEFGVNYYSQKLESHETRDFVLIYEVPNDYYKSTFKLKYLYNAKLVDGKVEYQYRTVKLSPKTFDTDKKTIDTKSLGDYISFNKSLLGDTKLRINNIKIADTFYYSTVKCQKGGCSSIVKALKSSQNSKFDMTLMRIDYDIIYDYDTLGKDYVNNELIPKYGSIRFVIGDKEYNNRVSLNNLTPYPTGRYVFIEVRDKLKTADKIYLDITIRGKVYTILIQDNTKEIEQKENE